MSSHEYVAYEQCLYYYLSNKAQHTSIKFGTVHPLATLPPSYADEARKSVKVQIGQVTLQHFQLNEFLKDLQVEYSHFLDV